MASEKEINQRLRSLHQDFDFLLDNNIISTDLYDDLTSQIPRRCPAKRQGSTTATAPAAAVSPAAPAPTSPQSTVSTLTSRLNTASVTAVAATSPAGAAAKSPPPPPTPAPSEPPPSYGLAQAEVLYDYTSTDEGDLQIHVGQRITILEYVNNDWWRGEGPTGQQGIFPSNYVRKIETPSMSEKGAYVRPGPPQYGYGQQYGQPPPSSQQYNPNPPFAQGQYQAPQQQEQQPQQEESKGGRLANFGKNYGRTFVNATAWGGGMALGSDVINSIF